MMESALFSSKNLDALRAIAAEAKALNAPIEAYAVAKHGISEAQFYRDLAQTFSCPFLENPELAMLDDPQSALKSGLAKLALERQDVRYAFAPRGERLERLLEHFYGEGGVMPPAVALTTPSRFEDAVVRAGQKTYVQWCAHSVSQIDPRGSARQLSRPRAVGWLLALEALALAGALLAPETTTTVICLLLGLFILMWTGLRLAASLQPDEDTPYCPALDDAQLPLYTVLVALYKEGNVVADLVDALRKLDWPVEKLDIKLLIEADDLQTRMALESLNLQPPFSVVTVPDGPPRTKPRALNMGLMLAQGALIAVYDAEDRPDPLQLRKAYAALRQGRGKVGCVQARLDIDNGGDSWLSSQFMLEYAVLFHILLPGFSRLSLPLPLGGTSNHFLTAYLRLLGGWDAWNVTEDADLGFRLARKGFSTHTILSGTSEEAPYTFRPWLKQRTRWIKGWMQTYLVHMQNPLKTYKELGFAGFFALQGIMAGGVLSPLFFPFALPLIGLQIQQGRFMQWDGTLLGSIALWIELLVLVAGTLGGFFPAFVLAWRQRSSGRFWQMLARIPAMPLYWLCVSIAGWRAAFQLVFDPHLWEKTDHGMALNRTSASQMIKHP